MDATAPPLTTGCSGDNLWRAEAERLTGAVRDRDALLRTHFARARERECAVRASHADHVVKLQAAHLIDAHAAVCSAQELEHGAILRAASCDVESAARAALLLHESAVWGALSRAGARSERDAACAAAARDAASAVSQQRVSESELAALHARLAEAEAATDKATARAEAAEAEVATGRLRRLADAARAVAHDEHEGRAALGNAERASVEKLCAFNGAALTAHTQLEHAVTAHRAACVEAFSDAACAAYEATTADLAVRCAETARDAAAALEEAQAARDAARVTLEAAQPTDTDEATLAELESQVATARDDVAALRAQCKADVENAVAAVAATTSVVSAVFDSVHGVAAAAIEQHADVCFESCRRLAATKAYTVAFVADALGDAFARVGEVLLETAVAEARTLHLVEVVHPQALLASAAASDAAHTERAVVLHQRRLLADVDHAAAAQRFDIEVQAHASAMRCVTLLAVQTAHCAAEEYLLRRSEAAEHEDKVEALLTSLMTETEGRERAEAALDTALSQPTPGTPASAAATPSAAAEVPPSSAAAHRIRGVSLASAQSASSNWASAVRDADDEESVDEGLL